MDAPLQRRALEVLEQAFDQPDESRLDWLIQTHAADPELVAAVQRLLRADATGAAALPTGGLARAAAPRPMPERIGNYRVVDRLGEGGMGEVFIGARDDGLFEHDVAIKLVRPSLLPETARALFHKERRALAKLGHRHIARLFDGGVDDSGAPYLIMELIRGAPIDAFVATHKLPLTDIVALFSGLCDAVQHAHQNLVVHADLKPDNILINEAGDAKIVDFGVARLLLDADARDAGAGDASGIYPQTPLYASPQRQAGAPPIPADDVYALGAVLRTLVASHPQAADGDFAAILARACAGDPADRYPSAAALRDDLRAWAEHRPLAARTHDRLHVLGKFLRRRRLRVAAAALGLAGLIIGLGVTTLLYMQADHARALAEARFADVRGLARYLLFDVYDRLEQTPRSLALRRDVAAMGETYLDELAAVADAPDDLRTEIIEGRIRLADLQAGRLHANLGDVDAARRNLAEAEVLAMQVELRRPGEARSALARIAIRRAAIAMNIEQDLEVAALALARAESFLVEMDGDDAGLLRLEWEIESATLANWRGEQAQAASIARAAQARLEALPDEQRRTRTAELLRARLSDALAEAIYYQGDLDAAAAEYLRLAEMTAASAEARPDDMEALRFAIRARWALATTLLALGRAGEGLAELDAAAALLPRLTDHEPEDADAQRLERVVLTARAQALAMNGRFDEGVDILRANVDARRALREQAPDQGDRARDHAVALAMLADLHADLGAAADACPLYAQARAIFADLERRGRLASLDRDNALRMIIERQRTHCGV